MRDRNTKQNAHIVYADLLLSGLEENSVPFFHLPASVELQKYGRAAVIESETSSRYVTLSSHEIFRR